MTSTRAWAAGLAAATIAVLATGCSTLRGAAALKHVEFTLDRVSDVRVAGITFHERSRLSDLGAADLARLMAAASDGRVPMDLVVHVRARNPAENRTTARIVDVDWTLFLEEREAASGRLEGVPPVASGETVDIPVPVSLDVLPFVRGSGRDLVELALSLAGSGGAPKVVRVDLMPRVETVFGRMLYPSRVTLRRTVGG